MQPPRPLLTTTGRAAATLLALAAISFTSALAAAQDKDKDAPTLTKADKGARKGSKPPRRAEQEGPRYGWLRIYSNYSATITVDNQPYPRRSEDGMKIDANTVHQVHVKLGDKEKTYTIVVKPRELRTLMIDLTGYNTPPTPAAPVNPVAPVPISKEEPAKEESEEAGENGQLTVYSKPRGEVYVDGAALGASTPMINRDLDVGRHEVQVKWENGEMSEVKTIRIRKGSKLKLFFRDRNNQLGDK